MPIQKTKVTLEGINALPKSVRPSRLEEAASLIGTYFGISKLHLVISNRTIETKVAVVPIKDCDTYYIGGIYYLGTNTIELFGGSLKALANERKKSILGQYAHFLVHEITHFGQNSRPGLPNDIAEEEAILLESLYAPIALKILNKK